ncbi:hypothetical protein TVAG_177680 [Trichomonas vaginalis G3]|uniref:Uncharacterized protein n=1 Tax=Trichomonas vaginalis (strain ATCC PRA-98 / G3) TaxID=412133 RepID=A2GD49_TRIV3|nr:hypothetical protein TVAGG3_0244460 [Trichomonas vaginalis G3]EAX84917.1 hypothetical protein TVAG_177680 [Trichomonas vaginalis G3]KAI5553563.1 hypothetical protein TVAGG3_0244460 [Trichomonas vaginalis G3]|eukprot:XP_001297847.1 hypothetical protein [Trichomonas vaginalis G3]
MNSDGVQSLDEQENAAVQIDPQMETSYYDDIDQLKKENAVLKSQLERACNNTSDIENLHKEKRELTSKLMEANQKTKSLQSRLKIAQQRNQDLEKKINSYGLQITNLNNDIDKKNKEITDLQSNVAELNIKEANAAKAKNELATFFTEFSSIADQKLQSFQQVLTFYKSIMQQHQSEIDDLNIEHQESEQNIVMTLKQVVKKSKKLTKDNELLNENNQKLHQLIDTAKGAIDTTEDQIQRLVEENSNLEAKLEESASQTTALQHEIESMKSKLEQEQQKNADEIQKYQELLNMRDSRIDELKNIMNSPEQTGATRINELVQENTQLKINLNNLSDQKKQSDELEKKVELKLRRALNKINSQKAEIAKYKKHLHNFSKEKICSTENTLKKEIEQLNQQNGKYAKEIDSLRTQLQAAEAAHVEGESAYNAVKNDNERLKNSIQSLENLINNQRNEITSLTNQRNRLFQLGQKSIQTLSKCELNAKNNQQKINELSQKLQKPKFSQRPTEFNTTTTDSCLLAAMSQSLIPLIDAPARDKLNSILADFKLTPFERSKLAFKEISDMLKQSKQNAENQEQNKQQNQSISNIQSLLEGMIRGFSVILGAKTNDDNAAGSINIPRDSALIDFIAEKTAQLELILQQNELLNPQFVSLDFLFTGSFEDRRRSLQEFACQGWDNRTTFDMFCLQALVNTSLSNELSAVRSVVETQNVQLEHIEQILGTSDPDFVHESLENIEKKIRKLKAKNKSLKQFALQMQEAAEKIDGNANLRSIIDELKKQIDSQVQELEKRSQTIQNLEKEKSEKQATIEAREAEIANLKNEIRQTQFDHRAEVAQFEKTIFQSNQEVREANMKVSQSSVEFEAKLQEQKKIAEDDRQREIAKQEKLERQILSLKEKIRKADIAAKQRENDYSKEAQKLVEVQNQLKQKLTDSIESLKTQSAENQELQRKLTESLRINEGKAQEMMKEISKLTASKKAAEVQIQSLQDQMKREADLIASQYNFKSVAQETKRQEEIAELKANFEKEKNALIIDVLEEFNALQSLGEEEIDESTFMSTIRKIAGEYRRVHA